MGEESNEREEGEGRGEREKREGREGREGRQGREERAKSGWEHTEEITASAGYRASKIRRVVGSACQ